jgi:hypothetical protein
MSDKEFGGLNGGATVNFDLELGPVVDSVHPPLYLSTSEAENMFVNYVLVFPTSADMQGLRAVLSPPSRTHCSSIRARRLTPSAYDPPQARQTTTSLSPRRPTVRPVRMGSSMASPTLYSSEMPSPNEGTCRSVLSLQGLSAPSIHTSAHRGPWSFSHTYHTPRSSPPWRPPSAPSSTNTG